MSGPHDRGRPAAPIPADTRTLAVVCPSWVGDTVMATAVFRAARSARPEARIIGLVRPGLDQVLAGSPWFDRIVVCDMKGLAGPWRLARAIRHARADAALILPNSFRAALAVWLSRTKHRAGYARDGRGWLLSHSLGLPQGRGPIAMVDYYAALGRWALDVDQISSTIELTVTSEQAAAADRILHDVKGRLIVLNPGANRADKRWPAERFAAVGDALASHGQCRVAVSGSPKERELVQQVMAAASAPFIDLVERGVTLGSLMGVIQRADLLITNDTGPRHFAAALGTPVITLFGPTDHRWTTLRCAREHLLLSEPFLAEERTADHEPRVCAIERIAVEDVLFAAQRFLKVGAAEAGA